MTALAALLIATLDVWSIPAGVSDVAQAGLPEWIRQAKTSVVTDEERRAVHLGRGLPAFSIDEREVPVFLGDLNPLQHTGSAWWEIAFPVLGRHDRVMGSLTVMCFTDGREPKVVGGSWGKRFPFTEVEQTQELPGVERVLGVVAWGICAPEWRVAYVDKTGNVALKAFSGSVDLILA